MRLAAFFVLLLVGLMNGAQAQRDYPAKPIRYVTGFPAGSGNDATARAIAAHLSEAWGKQVVVDNRPGAGSIVATQIVAQAPPDGYTLLMGSGSLTIAPSLHDKLPYDALRDFAPITQIASFPSILVVHPSLPVSSVSELVNYARTHPGQLSYGSSGHGGVGHLAMELFKSMAQLDMVHVPYKSASLAFIDMAGGRVQVMLASVVTGMPQVRAGKIRLLAVTSAKRSSAIPATPTIAESGYPKYEVIQWFGILAKRGTPREIIVKLNGELARIVRRPPVADLLTAEGADVGGNSPEDFGRFLKADVAKWAALVKSARIRAETF